MSKIESENKRTENMKRQKEELLRRRQQAKIAAQNQRQMILAEFEKMKITKKFPSSLTQQLNLSGVSGMPAVDAKTATGSRKRPASATAKLNSPAIKPATTSSGAQDGGGGSKMFHHVRSGLPPQQNQQHRQQAHPPARKEYKPPRAKGPSKAGGAPLRPRTAASTLNHTHNPLRKKQPTQQPHPHTHTHPAHQIDGLSSHTSTSSGIPPTRGNTPSGIPPGGIPPSSSSSGGASLRSKAGHSNSKSHSKPPKGKAPRSRPASSTKSRGGGSAAGAAVAGSNEHSMSRDKAIAHVEGVRRRQNEYLLQILEEEQSLEEQREQMMQQVRNAPERRRLEKIFGVERAKASERIMRITEEHETVLTQKIARLGLLLP